MAGDGLVAGLVVMTGMTGLLAPATVTAQPSTMAARGALDKDMVEL